MTAASIGFAGNGLAQGKEGRQRTSRPTGNDSMIKLTSAAPAHHASEYMVVDESNLVAIPEHMTYAQAAALPIACGTAWSMLNGATKVVKAGDTVICMGTGGVAVFVAAVSFATLVKRLVLREINGLLLAKQVALISGAKVIMTSSSDSKLDEVRSHLSNWIRTPGHFLGINRREHREWDKQIAELTDGKLGDFLLEIGGVKTLPSSIRSVKAGGLIALTGYLSNDEGGDATESEPPLYQLCAHPETATHQQCDYRYREVAHVRRTHRPWNSLL